MQWEQKVMQTIIKVEEKLMQGKISNLQSKHEITENKR